MFKQKWDSSSNGILLTNTIDKNILTPSIRPVFYEELDILEFDKYWIYPKSDAPLLWAIGRKYYNNGEKGYENGLVYNRSWRPPS